MAWGKSKKDIGLGKIEGVVGKFNNMVEDLTEGVNQLNAQKGENTEEITRLTKENADIDSNVEVAEGVRDGLRNILKPTKRQ